MSLKEKKIKLKQTIIELDNINKSDPLYKELYKLMQSLDNTIKDHIAHTRSKRLRC